jgi:hypothetical protein
MRTRTDPGDPGQRPCGSGVPGQRPAPQHGFACPPPQASLARPRLAIRPRQMLNGNQRRHAGKLAPPGAGTLGLPVMSSVWLPYPDQTMAKTARSARLL